MAEGRPVNGARIGCIPCPEKKRTMSDKEGNSGTGGDSGGSEVTPRGTPLSSELATGSVTAGVPRRPRYGTVRPPGTCGPPARRLHKRNVTFGC